MPCSRAASRRISRSSTTSLRPRRVARTSRFARSWASCAGAACASRTTPSRHVDAGDPLQLLQLRLRPARSARPARRRRAHRPPRRRRDHPLPRLRRRHRRAASPSINAELADATIAISHATIDMYRQIGIELVEPHVVYNAVRPAIFHPRRTGAVRPRPEDARDRDVVVGQSPQGRADLPLARGAPRLGSLRVHLRRERTVAASSASRHVPPCRPASSPRFFARTTSSSPRRRTTRTRTRSSRRSSCGLPAVYLDSGGSAEAVKEAGFGFARREEIPGLLDRLVDEYEHRQARISLPSLAEVVDGYLEVLGLDEFVVTCARRVGDPRARGRRRLGHHGALAAALAALPGRRGRRLGDRPGAARARRRRRAARRRVADPAPARRVARPGGLLRQPVHASRRTLARAPAPRSRPRTSTGGPGRPACRSSTRPTRRSRAHHDELERVQVTHAEMHDLVLSSGIDPAKVFRIRSASTSVSSRSAAPRLARKRARRARPAGRRLRRRLVPEGRRRLGRRGGAEADQGARRARRGAAHLRERRARADVLLSGPARGYVARRPRAARHSLRPRAVGDDTRASRACTPRSTRTSSRRDRREGRRACSSRWRAAYRSSRRASGQATELVDDGVNG